MGDASYKTGLIFQEHNLQDNGSCVLMRCTFIKNVTMLSLQVRFMTDGQTDGRTTVEQYGPDLSMRGNKARLSTDCAILAVLHGSKHFSFLSAIFCLSGNYLKTRLVP